MQNREEKFKAFLMSVSDDKKQKLFEYLKSLNPDERTKAIDTILARLEAVNNDSNNSQPVKKTAPTPSNTENTKVVPTPNKEQIKPANKPQVQPQNKKVAPSSGVAFPNSNPASKPKTVSTSAPKKQQSNPTKISSKTKRDLVIVAIVLVIFTTICVGVKLFLNKVLPEDGEIIETTTTIETISSFDSDVATSVEETTEVTETTELTPTPTPAPTSVPLNPDAPDLTGMVIVIDPGHQMETSSEEESVASWNNSTKKRATTGAVGKATGIPEYELTLDIAIIMKDYLEQCGATVILTRYENDVDISNQERALVATENNANLFIRLHADKANDSMTSGVRVFVPDSGDYVSSSVAWGDILGTKVSDRIGLGFIGTKSTSLYTGLNYANSVPSFQISLGLLSNSDDEAVLIDENNQVAISAAVAEFAYELK